MKTLLNEKIFTLLGSAFVHFEFSLINPEIILKDCNYKKWKQEVLNYILTPETTEQLNEICSNDQEVYDQCFYLIFHITKKEAFIPEALNHALNYLHSRDYFTHHAALEYFSQIY
jgi:hypothetical protein